MIDLLRPTLARNNSFLRFVAWMGLMNFSGLWDSSGRIALYLPHPEHI